MAGPQSQTTGSLISLGLRRWPPPVQSFPGQSHNCCYQSGLIVRAEARVTANYRLSYLQMMSYAKLQALRTFYHSVCKLRHGDAMQCCPPASHYQLIAELSQINCKNTEVNSATYLQHSNCYRANFLLTPL